MVWILRRQMRYCLRARSELPATSKAKCRWVSSFSSPAPADPERDPHELIGPVREKVGPLALPWQPNH